MILLFNAYSCIFCANLQSQINLESIFERENAYIGSTSQAQNKTLSHKIKSIRVDYKSELRDCTGLAFADFTT